MRVFKTKAFARFAARAGIANAALCEAVLRAERGLIDADLGGGVVKQRIARGFRSIVLFRRGTRAIFVHGFAKSDQSNISPGELAGFRALAAVMLDMAEAATAAAMANGTLTEIDCHA